MIVKEEVKTIEGHQSIGRRRKLQCIQGRNHQKNRKKEKIRFTLFRINLF